MRAAPFANIIGWYSDFEIQRVLPTDTLKIDACRPWPPFRLMTFLLLTKRDPDSSGATGDPPRAAAE